MLMRKIRVNQVRLANRATVSTCELEDGKLMIIFKRRLTDEDVKDGVLRPATDTYVRKGKRITTLHISPDSEEALLTLLQARKTARLQFKRTMHVMKLVERLFLFHLNRNRFARAA